MNSMFVLAAFLVSLPCVAKNSLLKPGYPAFGQIGEPIQYEPLAGNHFNTKAPQYCGEMKAKKVLEHELICEFKRAGTYRVNLKICDNAKTFCKSEKAEVTILDPLAKKSK